LYSYSMLPMVIWRELNCVKIPRGEASKIRESPRWGKLRAKGEVVPLSVYIYPLLLCGSNAFLLHDFAAYFYLQQ
jgi:hypothetical protein